LVVTAPATEVSLPQAHGYEDANTHIHPSANATKAFMNALEFPGPWDGTIERELPIMDKSGIATTMIVPLIADAKLRAERTDEEAERGRKPDRDRLIAQLAAEQSAYNSWAAATGWTRSTLCCSHQWTGNEIQARPARRGYQANYPSRFEEVVRAYPRLKLVLAHLGMGAEDLRPPPRTLQAPLPGTCSGGCDVPA
jgi:hypothetical protein